MRDRLTATTFAPLTKFTADVAWTYNASANLLTDAFLSFAGNVTPRTATISEILSNDVTLSLNAPGATSQIFPTPIGSVFAIKDQAEGPQRHQL
jgi:hypothetical protein